MQTKASLSYSFAHGLILTKRTVLSMIYHVDYNHKLALSLLYCLEIKRKITKEMNAKEY